MEVKGGDGKEREGTEVEFPSLQNPAYANSHDILEFANYKWFTQPHWPPSTGLELCKLLCISVTFFICSR